MEKRRCMLHCVKYNSQDRLPPCEQHYATLVSHRNIKLIHLVSVRKTATSAVQHTHTHTCQIIMLLDIMKKSSTLFDGHWESTKCKCAILCSDIQNPAPVFLVVNWFSPRNRAALSYSPGFGGSTSIPKKCRWPTHSDFEKKNELKKKSSIQPHCFNSFHHLSLQLCAYKMSPDASRKLWHQEVSHSNYKK